METRTYNKTAEILDVIHRYNEREKYYTNVVKKRHVPFSDYEESLSDYRDTVEYAFECAYEHDRKQKAIAGMKKALLNLSDDERRIIKECFYFNGSRKPSYSELAEKYNISRQAYCKRLNKVLLKLRRILKENFENPEINNIQNFLISS